MFDRLTERLGEVFGQLTRRGALSPADVDAALREVRVALLEADVALPVVREFLAKVHDQAVGETVLKSVTPGQMVVRSSTTRSSRRWAATPSASTSMRRRRW